MVAVHGIATSAEIVVMSIRCQHIINIIINALKRKTRSILISLGSMVKHNIQNDFHAVCLEFTDQQL